MRKKAVQPQDKFVLRLPDGLRHLIKEAADRNNRSMNAEIVLLLEEAFIDQTFSERMEQLSVQRELQSKAGLERRLADIESKIEQILMRLAK